MLRLQQIDAQNFRSLADVSVSPSVDGGITVLAGPNGAGKSSLVHALSWALYGATPRGVTVRGLRRLGSDGQPCRVAVTVTHAGDTVVVERALKGTKDNTVATVTVNGDTVVNGSAAATTAWVTRRLGLDADAFFTVSTVRQKDGDRLLRAVPAERKKMIERMALIERQSVAVKMARDAETDAKKLLAALPGSADLVDAAAASEQRAADALIGAQSAAAKADETALTARHAFDSHAARIQQLADRVNAAKAADVVVAAADADRKIAVAARSAAVDALSGIAARAASGSVDALEAARARETDSRALLGALRNQQNAHIRACDQLATATATVTAAQAAASADEEALKSATAAASGLGPAGDMAALEQLVTKARTTVDDMTGQQGALRGEYARLTGLRQQVAAMTDPTCPTCSQAVPDRGHLLDAIDALITVCAADGLAFKEKILLQRQALQQAEKAVADERTANAERDRVLAAVQASQAAFDRSIAAVNTAIAVEQDAGNAVALNPPVDQGVVAAADEALQKATTERINAESAAEAAERLPGAQEAVAAAERDVETRDGQHREAVERRDAIDAPDGAEVDVARQTWVTLKDDVQNAEAAARQAAVTVGQCDGDLKVAVSTRKLREAEVDARAKAARALEAKTATRQALEAFRVDRLSRLAPELAEVTSDLVARVTNGRFVAVNFDEHFTPIVTADDGTVLAAASLSGGEESMVALAMCIGIGDIVAGSAGHGPLVLDEVLTAQDADRRAAFIEALREIPDRQIIMINHMAEALDIADVAVEFQPGADGSTATVLSSETETVPELHDVLAS